jgi:hypothetical protein
MIVAVLLACACTLAHAAWSDGHDGADRPGGVIIDSFHPVFGMKFSVARTLSVNKLLIINRNAIT